MKRSLCMLLTVLLLCSSLSVTAAAFSVKAVPNSFGLQPWGSYSEGLCVYAKNSSIFGYIDTNGKIAIPAKYTVAHDFSEGLAMVVLNGKVCYIDRTGKVAIDTGYTYNYDAYSWVSGNDCAFHNGIASVANDSGLWGAIDTKGRLVIPCQYDRAMAFVNGWAQVGCSYIDRTGTLRWPNLDPGTPYLGAVIELKDGRLLGVADGRVGGFMGTSMEVYAYDLLDSTGRLIRSISPSEGEKLMKTVGIVRTYSGSVSVIEAYGLDANRYLTAEEPSDGMILASVKYEIAKTELGGNIYVYVDAATGREVLGPYEYAKSFREGYAWVRPVGSSYYTLIDRSGKQMLPNEYDSMSSGFHEGHLLLGRENSLYVAKSGTDGFKDVAPGQYYYAPVSWAVGKQITNGTSPTAFSPEQTCTRGQIITFLWRAAGSPAPEGAAPCSDVDTGDYYHDAVAWAYETGMTAGSTFAPKAPCTRQMAVDFMWKAAGSPAMQRAVPFTDVNSTQKEAVAWAVQMGITNGTSATTFSPEATCTRGQIVTFLYRTLPITGYYRVDYPTNTPR